MYAIDFTKLSGTPKLFLDFISCTEPACKYFRYDFREIEAYRRVSEKIDQSSYPREKLASILIEAVSNLGFSPATMDNIKRIGQRGSLCVFGGQQVGILLGPMYSILKALTAYKLAKRLEKQLGRPVIPCFWMATDDHDFDEVKSAGFLDRDGNCRSVSYEPGQKPVGQPMSNLFLDGEIEKFVSGAEELLIETEFTGTIKGWIRQAYRPGKSLSLAFAELFEIVMRDLGIVPVDPNFPGLKSLFEPVFRRDIENHDTIFKIFESRSREIIESGYHRQVHKSGDALNLFFDDGIRRNIILNNGRYSLDGHAPDSKKYELDEIISLLNRDPAKFSPNVTLRPIAQCHAFPTVSQIVGPSEAAYFAQIAPLFDFHGIPWPVIRPRIFASLVEPQIGKILRKLSIDFAGIVNDIEFEVGRVIRENYPPEIQLKAEQLRTKIENPLIELAESVKSRDLESYQALDFARRKIDHELNHLAKKLLMAHKKQHDEVSKRVHKAASFLLPCGNFQERVLSPIYFLNKFGPDLTKLLESELDLDSTGHQMVEVGS